MRVICIVSELCRFYRSISEHSHFGSLVARRRCIFGVV